MNSQEKSGTSRLAVKSLGRVWDQQYSCEVSMKSLGTSSIAVKSLGKVKDQQSSCEVSWKSLGTSRIAVQFHRIVWVPAG